MPQHPWSPPAQIDPIEFFGFLAGYDSYPTNGLRLAQAAADEGRSNDLVAFFQGIPGKLDTEADILPYAEEPCKPPLGSALSTVNRDPAEIAAATAAKAASELENGEELTVSDITEGKPHSA